MNLGALLALLWLREKVKEEKREKSDSEFYTLGEYCPQDGKFLKPDQVCINNQVQPRLPN